MEAQVQMGSTFSDAHEAETWKAENKDLANLTHPFSGSERNRLFLNRDGKDFIDISGLSGVDSPADGRVSVWFDYDRDGRQDLAVINSSSPLLQIYHNETGSEDASTVRHGFVAMRFVGGNQSALSAQTSNRNGFGVKVRAVAGGRTLFREHLPSQGMSGQNSEVMIIGIGTAGAAEEIEVTWPSGKVQTIHDVSDRTSLTVYEDPTTMPSDAQSAGADGFVLFNQATARPRSPAPDSHSDTVDTAALVAAAGSDRPDSQLVVLTTFASWCTSCARHQPGINELRTSFTADEVEIIGFTGDPDDSPSEMEEFRQRHNAGYPAIVEPDEKLWTAIDALIQDSEASNALPASLIIAKDGRVLAVESSVPTASRLRQLLNAQ